MGRLRDSRFGYLDLLKGRDLEEFPDLLFYRPLAYLGVRLAVPTRLTPNQVTILSICFGFLGGWFIAVDTPGSLRWGAAAILVFNVLDCMDGMLARARGVASPFGYVLDGVAGYVGTAAIMLGIGHAVASRHGQWFPWWPLTIIAGISQAWWCAVVDGMRLEWMWRVQGKRRDRASELAALVAEADVWRREGTHRVNRALVACYTAYVRLWGLGRPAAAAAPCDPSVSSAAEWAAAHRPVMRLALLAGPTMQVTVIVLAAALDRLDWFLWLTIVIGNAWAAGVLTARAGVRRRPVAEAVKEV